MPDFVLLESSAYAFVPTLPGHRVLSFFVAATTFQQTITDRTRFPSDPIPHIRLHTDHKSLVYICSSNSIWSSFLSR